jgi:hypothetical protein
VVGWWNLLVCVRPIIHDTAQERMVVRCLSGPGSDVVCGGVDDAFCRGGATAEPRRPIQAQCGGGVESGADLFLRAGR